MLHTLTKERIILIDVSIFLLAFINVFENFVEFQFYERLAEILTRWGELTFVAVYELEAKLNLESQF